MGTQAGKHIEVIYAHEDDRALAVAIGELCRSASLCAEVRPARHALPEMVIAVHPGAERDGLALLSRLESELRCELAAAGVCLWIGGLPGTAFFELPHYASKARMLLERVAAGPCRTAPRRGPAALPAA
jgi:hypothetical protein